jgi:hypothetical protein
MTGTSQGVAGTPPANAQGISTPPNDGQVTTTDSVSDPWAAAATQYRQQPQAADANGAQEPAWKVWEAQDTPEQPMPLLKRLESNWDSNTKLLPSDGTFGTALQNFGGSAAQAVKAMTLDPILHPLDTAKGLLNTGIVGDFTGKNPLVQYGQQFRQEWQKDKPQALEHLAGDVAGAALTGGLLKGVPEIPGEVSRTVQRINPSPSSAIVPPAEMAARKLTQVILPANKDAAGFVTAAQREVPNILQYARDNGNPLNTQLEFSKAAEGNAKTVRDFYQNNVLGPNDQVVSVNGTGYQGPTVGEGNRARLSDIDQRVVQINKELSGPSSKMNAGDVRSALASKTALQNEAAALTQLLHGKLAEATGLAPQDIANLRQRVGRSYELANDTNAAVTGRMQAEGRAKLQPVRVHGVTDLMTRGVNALRGGSSAIADRGFQKAIRNYPGTPDSLPQLKRLEIPESLRTQPSAVSTSQPAAAPNASGMPARRLKIDPRAAQTVPTGPPRRGFKP